MEHKYTNRLAQEKSPYLLQHAHNPVDWYPWGKEAFAKAEKEGKPIFLSVGYSTCHWCHVMERESFENEEIAAIMNEKYVNIKVDREENPGVDKMYMTYVQIMTGGGGWPMSVFLTPDLYPIFGATYFPPTDHFGRPGFRTVLNTIYNMWQEKGDQMRESGQDLVRQIQDLEGSKPSGSSSRPLTWAVADQVYEHKVKTFDPVEGGFGRAPKFPSPVHFDFLLMYSACRNAKSDTAKKAIDMKIAAGGIHDHVGSGFHRYSTDAEWHVPHFEKMLYDQGQLLRSYADIYTITKDPAFADVARDIVKYVGRDLWDAAGGLYSAEDADSLPTFDATEKEEGAFCVWEMSELENILGIKDAAMYSEHYGTRPSGNVSPSQDPHGELKRKNVLIQRRTIEETARAHDMTPDQVKELLTNCNQKLLKYRQEQRPKPHCDDKILTSWNGLMLTGLAKAYGTFGDDEMLTLAKGITQFIETNLYKKDEGILIRSYREGPSAVEGFIDDYTYLIQGLLDLYEATFDESYVEWAAKLQAKQDELFWDDENGGYYLVQAKEKDILMRMKDFQDGAEPSPNGIAASNLLRLGYMLEANDLTEKAAKVVQSFQGDLLQHGYAAPALVSALMMQMKGMKQIVLTGDANEPLYQKFLAAIREAFIPNKVLLRATPKDGYLASRNSVQQLANESDVAAYICENFTCGLPIKDVESLRKQLA